MTPVSLAARRYYRDLLALGHPPKRAWALVVKKMGGGK